MLRRVPVTAWGDRALPGRRGAGGARRLRPEKSPGRPGHPGEASGASLGPMSSAALQSHPQTRLPHVAWRPPMSWGSQDWSASLSGHRFLFINAADNAYSTEFMLMEAPGKLCKARSGCLEVVF